MKKIILVILILLLLGGGYYLWQSRRAETNTNTPTTNTEGELEPDPSNATFIVEDESITLSQGRNENPLAGSAIVEETVLMDKFAYGDINGDSKNDTVLLLVRYGGGSGTFVYVAGYVSSLVNYKGTNAIFVGDRIAPQSVSINNQGVITVSYLDRKPDDALSTEPAVPASKQFVYTNGQLQER